MTIRPKQLARLEEATRERLAWEVVESLRESSPHSVQGLSEAEQQERVATARRKADEHRFEVVRDLRAFFRLSFEIGPNFDEHPPFQAILRGPDAPSYLQLPPLFEYATGQEWVRAAVYDIASRSRDLSDAGHSKPNSVSLVPLAREHAKPFFRQSLHPDVWRLANLTPFRSVEQTESYILAMKRDATQNYAIIDPVIGFVGLVAVDHREPLAQIFYWVGRPFWGCGVATAAVKQQIRILQDHSDLKEIMATTYPGNSPSIRVLKKCGFVSCSQEPPGVSPGDAMAVHFRRELR